MLTQAIIDQPDEIGFPVKQRKPIAFNRPMRSVECIPGCNVALVAARRAEKQAKAKMLADQQPEPRERPEPRWVAILGPVAKYIGLTAAGVFGAMVLVQMVKGMVR